MRLDEMIIKANADGKTYFCNGTDFEYSKEKGFMFYSETEKRQVSADVVCTESWQEKPKRHLTVSEAEKELDCVIDTPDISKLFRPMSEVPNNSHNVVLVYDKLRGDPDYCGYHDTEWFRYSSEEEIDLPFHWIDPADLTKLLPKE